MEIKEGTYVTYESPIPIGNTVNANPRVIETAVDRRKNEITFFGRDVGFSEYVVTSREDPSVQFHIDIEVVVNEDLESLKKPESD